MNIKRAIGIIFLVLIAGLIVEIIESKLFGVDLKEIDPASIPLAMWYISIIATVVESAVGAIWFFKSSETVPSTKNGFFFGLLFVIIGFIGIIVLLIFYQDGATILLKYYAQPKFWAMFILSLAACTSVGYIKAKKIKVGS